MSILLTIVSVHWGLFGRSVQVMPNLSTVWINQLPPREITEDVNNVHSRYNITVLVQETLQKN